MIPYSCFARYRSDGLPVIIDWGKVCRDYFPALDADMQSSMLFVDAEPCAAYRGHDIEDAGGPDSAFLGAGPAQSPARAADLLAT